MSDNRGDNISFINLIANRQHNLEIQCRLFIYCKIKKDVYICKKILTFLLLNYFKLLAEVFDERFDLLFVRHRADQ